MTTPLRTSHLYDDPGALIAAVPGLLTFHPDDSLVLITYAGTRQLDLESVLRVDLPPAEHATDVAMQLCLVATNHGAVMADLIVLGGRGSDPPDRLPHRALVEYLGYLFDEYRITLGHAVWASRAEQGRTWWCYHDKHCTGQIRDPATSPLAAAMAIPGATTHRTREDLAALLAPDPETVLAPRAALLDGLSSDFNTDEEYAFIRATVDNLDATELDDLTIARLARALSNHDIREACLAYPLTPRAERAERLWTALTRTVPDSARADPACLLAVSTYLRGEGTLASMALDLAEAANPTHELTSTLREVIDLGFPPRRFRLMLAESLANADDATPEPPTPDTPPSQPDPTPESPQPDPNPAHGAAPTPPAAAPPIQPDQFEPTPPDPSPPDRSTNPDNSTADTRCVCLRSNTATASPGQPAPLQPADPIASVPAPGPTPTTERAYTEPQPAPPQLPTTVPPPHTPATPNPHPGPEPPANPEHRPTGAAPNEHPRPQPATPWPPTRKEPDPDSANHAPSDTTTHLAAVRALRAATGRPYQGRHRAA